MAKKTKKGNGKAKVAVKPESEKLIPLAALKASVNITAKTAL